jgi:capsular exopolysaccharide synthesis family protein
MELRKLLNIVSKWLWLAILAVAIAAGSSYIASKAATPLYRTKTTLMIGRFTQVPDPNSTQLYTSQQLAFTYIQLAQREPVLKGAIESLGLQMDWHSLIGRVVANNVQQTQLLEISLVDSDPFRAKILVDAIAQELVLLSPGNQNNPEDEAKNAFTQSQLDDLQTKIEDGQKELLNLKTELDAANSSRQIQDLQNQVLVLQSKVSSWQSTYSQLLLSLQGGDVNVLSVVEKAAVPSVPFSPNIRNNVLIAAVIGLILAMGGAFLIEYLDDTIKNPDDVTRVTNLTTLGVIPQIVGDEYKDKLISISQPLSPIVESFRILRTNLQFSTLDKPLQTLMVTSPGPSEGKSISMTNLAVVLAQSGLKVILVDTDLRRPTVHKIFNVTNRKGLSNAILHFAPITTNLAPNGQFASGKDKREVSRQDKSARIDDLFHNLHVETGELPMQAASMEQVNYSTETEVMDAYSKVEEYLLDTPVENLRLLTSGPLPPNPAEMLGSERMRHLIEALKFHSDLVLFDSPPCLVVADAAIMSTRVDGVIIVNDAGRTRTNEIRRAVDELHRVRANVLGIILNRVSRARSGYNYYYNYYQDGDKKRRSKPQGLLGRVFSRGSNNHKSPNPVPTIEE